MISALYEAAANGDAFDNKRACVRKDSIGNYSNFLAFRTAGMARASGQKNSRSMSARLASA
jgi:hypothetical protein